ncbi:type VI secretion system Vgr family protein [Massilia aerilata]|uniref:Type VI secretion system Vgr family protein n=1 Tax=Massilia aerilata TaxID=453817 RepID=A0ABW0RUD7_9BURK
MGESQAIAAGAARSAFSGESQHKRLMRLDFPRKDGPDAILLPNKLKVTEAVSRCFKILLEVLSDDTQIPLKAMMARMVTISLVREDGSLRYFNGYVTEFRFLRADGGFAFYHMVLEPWLAFTKLRKDNRSFLGKSVIDITELTFAHYRQNDWHPVIVEEYPRLTCANQYDETDYNHLHRRWEELGLHYYYEHRADGHTLFLRDRSTLAQPIDSTGIDDSGEIPFRDKAGSLEDDGIREWIPMRRLGSGQTTLVSFDYKNPVAQRSTAESLNKQGDVYPYEIYEDTGAYGFRTHDNGERLAQQRMGELDANTQTFEARGNDRTAQPGRCFKLADHFSAELRVPKRGEPAKPSIRNRDYLILSVDHEASNNYQAGPGAPSHYENSFRCVRRDIQWRPGRHYNSQPCTCHGIQTAIVVGPAGAEIHTDGYGRVKIQFHWDRLGKRDENSSAWVRVMSPGAGVEFGNIRLPRVGEEVGVVFVNGNIDHPLILGVLYNYTHMPPWQLPEQQALSGLRSRELQAGEASGRGNHLVLDDTPGKIQAQLKSDHQCSQLSLGRITRIEDTSGRRDERGEGWELRTDGHGVARAAQGMLITTEARQAARGPVKDLDETARRLALATEQHQLLAEIAQKNGAQEAGDNQDDVASVLQAQNDAIGGVASKAGSFPELGKPHLVMASPAGIATTTAGDTHIASDRHTAVTTGKSLSLAAGMNFFASVRQAFRLFVQKAGMKMVAAAGDIDVQALSDSIKLLAKLEITHTANRITISAKEEVVINGGGSYAKFTAGGIEHGTNGTFVSHAAHHSLVDAKNMEMAIAMPPVTEVMRKGRAALYIGSHAEAAGRISAGLPFKLFKDGALVEQGQVDDKGNIRFAHELDAAAGYKVEFPTGQSFDIAPSNYAEQHEINAGVGYHGYENPGGFLSEDAVSLDQDRIDANPRSSDRT